MTKKDMAILPVIASVLAQGIDPIAIKASGIPDPTLVPTLLPKLEPRILALNKKEIVKSGITHKQPKPGKNKPAKGYDPVTKTWQK